MEQKSYMMFFDYLDECEKGSYSYIHLIYIVQMIKNNFLVDSKMPNNDALQSTDNVCKSSMSTQTLSHTLLHFLYRYCIIGNGPSFFFWCK